MGLLQGVGFVKANCLVINAKVEFLNRVIRLKKGTLWGVWVCWYAKISKFSTNFWS